MNYTFNTFYKKSFSNTLIIFSLIFTVVASFNWNLYDFWMHKYFLVNWSYINLFFQFIIYSFLHWWIMHFLSNALFLYFFWNILELKLKESKYISLFIFSTIFSWLILLFFAKWTTVWISWFCLSIVTYYTCLQRKWSEEFKWWITAIVLSLIVWIWTNISLLWHASGALAWYIFYKINKK